MLLEPLVVISFTRRTTRYAALVADNLCARVGAARHGEQLYDPSFDAARTFAYVITGDLEKSAPLVTRPEIARE
jgi:hypothetical protein